MRVRRCLILIPATLALLVPERPGKAAEQPKGGAAVEFKLTSQAFNDGAAIPVKYTGDGANGSPPLVWTEPPAGTVALALIADDPDAPAGAWVHWVLYDVPPATRGIAASLPRSETVLGGARQGRNDSRGLGYDGPAPPRGKPHRYFFTLYAVNAKTGLPAGATKREVLAKIEGHVLATAKLMGTYRR